MKQIYLPTLLIGLIGYVHIASAQQLIQKILPPETGISSSFGANGAIAMDGNTIIVGDSTWKSNNVADTSLGAVIIYKKIKYYKRFLFY